MAEQQALPDEYLGDVRLFDRDRGTEAGQLRARGVDFANQRPARRIHLEAHHGVLRYTTVTAVTELPGAFLNYDIKVI